MILVVNTFANAMSSPEDGKIESVMRAEDIKSERNGRHACAYRLLRDASHHGARGLVGTAFSGVLLS